MQVTKEAEYCRLGKQALIVTSEDQESTLFKFDSIHSKRILYLQFSFEEYKITASGCHWYCFILQYLLFIAVFWVKLQSETVKAR